MSTRLLGVAPEDRAQIVAIGKTPSGKVVLLAVDESGGLMGGGHSAGLFINDTGAHTGAWTSFQATTATVGTFVASNITGAMTGITVPAGGTVYGNFTSITLASGSGIAYA
jgi:hypothetical protein